MRQSSKCTTEQDWSTPTTKQQDDWEKQGCFVRHRTGLYILTTKKGNEIQVQLIRMRQIIRTGGKNTGQGVKQSHTRVMTVQSKTGKKDLTICVSVVGQVMGWGEKTLRTTSLE